MNCRFVCFRSRLAPALAVALGMVTFGGMAARAQTLPACLASDSNQAACTVGNIVFSSPAGVFSSGFWRRQAAILSDPYNPGFSTGNIAETSAHGQMAQSGSFTVATLNGVPAIAGLSASATCGVTGEATAGLSVSMDNGQSFTLTCPSFASQPITPGTAIVTRSISFAPVSSLTVNVTASGSISGGSVTWTDISGQLSLNPIYYFPHLAFGGGWQTTLTYVNYSPQSVSCQTTFLSESGQPLVVPFADQASATRTDILQPGGSMHVQTQPADALVVGWAYAQCTGPVKASQLFRSFSNGAAQAEAGVNAMSAPARNFVTFAQYSTGIAWANPSTTAASVTITAIDAATGLTQGTTTFDLAPNAHGANNIYNLFNVPSTFTGSVQITSTIPIVSLSLNFEAAPVFSSLPPGDLPDGTPLAGQH